MSSPTLPRLPAQLLPTKLLRPQLRRPSVSRPRLFALLDRGRCQQLSLVCGPAGSGKSTLLSAWLAQSGLASAWLSLDATDNEPRRLLAYLTQALRKIAPEAPADVASLLASSELDAQAFLLNLLLPALHEHGRPSILVLDDVHVVHAPQALQILQTFVHHKPSSLHVVLAARREPDLGLASLRAKAQLNELRADELRFSAQEAEEFYRVVMKLDLSAAQVAAIEAHTEGWAAACQLAALRLQSDGHGAGQLAIDCLSYESAWVGDYLLEEVIGTLAAPVHHLLLVSSVLQRMCDPLCAALVAPARPAASLRGLERENLLVQALDSDGVWYRHHAVMSTFLRKRLERLMPEQLPELHRRASRWFAARELDQEALEHAIAAGDPGFLAELLEGQAARMLGQGQPALLRRGLDALEVGMLQRRPSLALAQAWCVYCLDSDADKLAFQVERAEACIAEHARTLPDDLRHGMSANLGTLRALCELRRGRYAEARALAERLVTSIPSSLSRLSATLHQLIGAAHLALGDFERAYAPLSRAQYLGLAAKHPVVALSAIASRAAIHHLRLDMAQTRELCRSGLRLARDHGYSLLPSVASLHVELGMAYFYQGKDEASAAELTRGITRHSLTHDTQAIAMAHCFLARLKLRTGDEVGARRALRESLAAARLSGRQDVVLFVLSYRALLDLQRGELESARRWAREHAPADVSSVLYRGHIQLVSLTVALYSDMPEQVLAEGQRLIEQQRQRGFELYVLILLLLRAVALERLGHVHEGAAALAEAARLAMPGQVKVYFQLWGPQPQWSQSLRRLSGAIEDRAVRSFLGPLLHVRDGSRAAVVHRSGASRNTQVLTKREIEVLAAIAAGMSNVEIAQQLFVSLPTIKTHIQHIFRKLEVKSRTAALRVARELGVAELRPGPKPQATSPVRTAPRGSPAPLPGTSKQPAR